MIFACLVALLLLTAAGCRPAGSGLQEGTSTPTPVAADPGDSQTPANNTTTPPPAIEESPPPTVTDNPTENEPFLYSWTDEKGRKVTGLGVKNDRGILEGAVVITTYNDQDEAIYCYQGDFVNGIPHDTSGNAYSYWFDDTNGLKIEYKGCYENGKRNGYGVMWCDQDSFRQDGQWRDDTFLG